MEILFLRSHDRKLLAFVNAGLFRRRNMIIPRIGEQVTLEDYFIGQTRYLVENVDYTYTTTTSCNKLEIVEVILQPIQHTNENTTKKE